MSLYALDALDEALAATRAFLWPLDRMRWAKLAIVAIFIGGSGTNLASASFGSDGNGGPPPEAVPAFDIGPRAWLLIAGIVGLAVVLALLFVMIGAIMEFVFIESLRNEAVTIRRYWSRRWRQGLRLFGFRLVLGVFLLASVLLVALPFLLPAVGVIPFGGGFLLVAFLALVPLFLVLAAVVGLINGFTTVFVVPIMVLEGCGVLAGWRQIWPTITAQWKQYLAYAVAGFFLSLLGGVIAGIATALGALVLLVPFGLLFAVGFGLFALVSELLGIVVLVFVALLFVLAVVAVAALAQVPIKTYLRYYALLVLGDIDAEFDLIPDRRAAVRTPSTEEET